MTCLGAHIAAEMNLPIAESAQLLEDLGFDYISMGEHVTFHCPTTNSFVSLAVAAGATKRIGLVSTITLLPLYPAALAAKMAADLGFNSGSRFNLGVGVGGEYPNEFAACGVPLAERGARTEEALEILRLLLREDNVTFQGRFWSFSDVSIAPRPPEPPPIWLGGRRPPALERAARHADVWMPYAYTPERFQDSLARVRARAASLGRDVDAIRGAVGIWVCFDDDRSKGVERAAALLGGTYGTDMRDAVERYAVVGTPEQCVERLKDYEAAGADFLMLTTLAETPSAHREAWQAIASDVRPQLASVERGVAWSARA